MLPESRMQELADETLGDIKGPNDEIAANPKKWGEPMLSWSLDELRERLAKSLRTAAREGAIAAYEDAENCCSPAHLYHWEYAAAIRARREGL